MSLVSTLELSAAEGECWDAVVIGAGPAGSVAAYLLARAGGRVLLIERKPLPRYKVCGACLSSSAVALLNQLGLGTLLENLPQVPLERMLLRRGNAGCVIPLRTHSGPGYAIAREDLDEALARAAVGAGAELVLGSTGHVQATSAPRCEQRRVRLHGSGQTAHVVTRTVILATGLGGLARTTNHELPERVERRARVGIGGTFSVEDGGTCPAEAILMAVGRHGYLGAVRLADGRINLAAAVDRPWLRQCGGASQAAQRLLHENGLPHEWLSTASDWSGTPALTRRPLRVASWRVLVAGDAAGYAEPFTGEGMTWAIGAGRAAAQLTLAALDHWSEQIEMRWQSWYTRMLRGRQRRCQRLAEWLRHPWIVDFGVRAAGQLPRVAALVARRIHQPVAESFP